MMGGWKQVAAMGLLGLCAAVGCHSEQPQRQPVDSLNPDDTGLQSKDVVDAADKMCRDLLADPNLNASRNAWTIVVDEMQDKTTDPNYKVNFNIFLQALKGDLAQKSNGRVQLIENKAEFYNLRNKELETGSTGDQFGQGGSKGSSQAISPDYSLTGTAMDLPNRSTNFYQIEFKLVNLHNRTLAFDRLYQVKVRRD
jgi:peptidoglycan-synthase activator LpoB